MGRSPDSRLSKQSYILTYYTPREPLNALGSYQGRVGDGAKFLHLRYPTKASLFRNGRSAKDLTYNNIYNTTPLPLYQL